MGSEYLKIKTSSEEFKAETEELLKSLEGKRVIIYGAGECFDYIKNNINIINRLNIIGITDKKFNNSEKDSFSGYRIIKTAKISNEEFDVILIADDENVKAIKEFLDFDLSIKSDKIQTFFKENIKDEIENYNFLIKNKFNKTLPKLLKRIKNKKVILYGAGVYLELIKKYFDLSSMNVIGISDKRFSLEDADKDFLGYKIIPPGKIEEMNPDYVLVATKYYIRIIEDLHYNLLEETKIKIKPLVDKSFITLFKEIQDMS